MKPRSKAAERNARGRNAVFGASFLLIVAMQTAQATAGIEPLAAQFTINHADPESSIPDPVARNKKPLEFGYFLQDLVTFAETAEKSGDHQAEARYYRAFTKAVPDSGAGFSKLCQSLQAGHNRDEAEAACRQVLGLPGSTLKDYLNFVHLVLEKKGDLTAEAREDVTQIIQHLRADPTTKLAASHLQCEYGVRIESVAVLEECTTALGAVAPGDPKTIAFQWALAVRRGDQKNAQQLVVRAKNAGVKPEGIARMERTTNLLIPSWRRWLVDWRLLLGLVAVAGAIVAGASLTRANGRHRLPRRRSA